MIYAMQAADGGPIKLGFTENLEARRYSLQSYYGRDMVVLWSSPGSREDEKDLLSRFAHLRYGRTEQFHAAPDLIAFIGNPDAKLASDEDGQFMQPVSNRVSVKIDAEAMYYAKIVATTRGIGVGEYLDSIIGAESREAWLAIKES